MDMYDSVFYRCFFLHMYVSYFSLVPLSKDYRSKKIHFTGLPKRPYHQPTIPSTGGKESSIRREGET